MTDSSTEHATRNTHFAALTIILLTVRVRIQPDIIAQAGQLGRLGVGIVAQSPQICPADRRLYALRDVTATVRAMIAGRPGGPVSAAGRRRRPRRGRRRGCRGPGPALRERRKTSETSRASIRAASCLVIGRP